MRKLMILRPLGLGKDIDAGFCVAGDELGQYWVIQLHGIWPDESSAHVACLKLFSEQIDERNLLWIRTTRRRKKDPPPNENSHYKAA